ncbi:dUTP diphosphatase [Falsiporphyromonas endometrii]|uniref:Deoxyuridine 5'-triphosphate nucleotidohydrolase n=1 Tax=Falsiporphyromonas endometrii TaxID=1387297 RepID=A0ABV9K8R3_9PORP
MTIKIINTSNNPLPQYATESSAGMDLRAYTSEEIVIEPMQRKLIHTGIHIELPVGYEAQIRPRSGLVLKNGITILNSPGTIDADYRGEIGIVLANLSDEPFHINNGDRIAQMVVAKYEKVDWETASTLSETKRADGGFGHSGK